MIKKLNGFLHNKKGMTLVELLTAFSILALMIFCFAPLMLSYLTNVTVAGDKIEQSYDKASALEVLLGEKIETTHYSIALNNVPIDLNSPNANINGQAVSSAVYESSVAAFGLSTGGTYAKDHLDNPTPDGTIDISTGYATFYTPEFGGASGIKVFPSSLTDDFKVAYITIYGDGIEFRDLNQCEFVTTNTKTQPATEIKLTKGVDYEIEYHPDFRGNAALEKNVLLLTIYGGGENISFETSPLVFKHQGQRYEIQIDAPMMIMVGEKSLKTDDEGNNYHYYVSRGEIDEEGNLLIHRRVMHTENDPNGGGEITLNSPMNDVEWVPADSADSYATANGEKYGYYVMCGDNGQVRRFWKSPDRTLTVDGETITVDGNYYWGGDYTYYTDYNFNRFNTPTYINSTDKSGNAYADKIYSTDTSFKFISQRSMTEKQHGYNLSSKEYGVIGGLINTSTGLLRGLSVVSVTYSNDAEFYGNHGEMYYYQLKKKSGGSSLYPTISEMRNMGSSWDGKGTKVGIIDDGAFVTNKAYGWLQTNTDSYYEVNGLDPAKIQNKDSYPITLTSVDAIYITGTGSAHKANVTASSEGSYYFTSTGDGDTSAEGATTNMNYPQSSYTLYCGYIPAMMDIFGEVTGGGTYRYPSEWKNHYANTDDGTHYDINNVVAQYGALKMADNRKGLKDNANFFGKWRMTLGVTPYYNNGASAPQFNQSLRGTLAYYKKNSEGVLGIGGWDYPYEYLVYYPYTNVEYAITGKFYDHETYNTNKTLIDQTFDKADKTKYTIAAPDTVINTLGNVQVNVTNGKVVDITISYLSHPFAIAVAANPTDDVVYDLANDKGSTQVFYWSNRRETITFLDAASTMVPAGENDIPVSLMVGYNLGGTVEFSEKGGDAYANVGSIMNNGIVFLRAGNYNVKTQNSANSQTYEYLATDNDGYKLNAESNVFHQFYYLNSRTTKGFHGENFAEPKKDNHIGNLYGAEYWQNNRHIQYLSIKGGTAVDANTTSSSYEYLRSHPLANTKVNCVAWGTTWDGYPEAMWGTENGTVLSWWVDTMQIQTSNDSSAWNDRSVDAEIQSYTWIDNVNGKTFALSTKEWSGTVGSALFNSGSNAGASFTPGSDRFKYFYDKGTQATSSWGSVGFINTLETINDIEFADDIWVAAGDQSNKNPADYSASGSAAQSDSSLKANEFRQVIRAYSDYPGNTGKGGSWINVRYWVDLAEDGTNKHTTSNATYHWRAVQISKQTNYNIVQINHVNGMWIATGYIDGTNGGYLNDEYDEGEKTVICWTYDPLIPCGVKGGWSEAVRMYDGNKLKDMNEMGGINSCATRD